MQTFYWQTVETNSALWAVSGFYLYRTGIDGYGYIQSMDIHGNPELIARTIRPKPSLFVVRRPSTYFQENMGKVLGD